MIKSLYARGFGYRKIAKFLNEKGIKTEKGCVWKSNYVHSVLKRCKERQERFNFRNKKYIPIFSKIWED